MSTYTASTHWQRGAQPFLDKRYSRQHRWSFDCGLEIPGSSSPSVVPVPMSNPACVDPEEAFVASLSSCHLLSFLSVAASAGYLVDAYEDHALGHLERNAEGKLAMTRVTLMPHVTFSGEKVPSAAQLQALHHAAHEACFIASSVRTEVSCEPRLAAAPSAPAPAAPP
jgi:organic hydroperoxide reductase OsmC/OhrA